MVLGRTDINQLSQRLRHRLHRPDLVFELQFLSDRQAAYVAAARVVIGPELK